MSASPEKSASEPTQQAIIRFVGSAHFGNEVGIRNFLALYKDFVDKKDHQGHTALMMATRYDQGNIIKILLENGANPNATDGDGWTPLMFACVGDAEAETIHMLSESGADLNLKNKDGRTALMETADRGYIAVVQALLECGANPLVRDNQGRTALDIAAPGVIRLLEKAEVVHDLKDYSPGLKEEISVPARIKTKRRGHTP